MRFLTFMLSCAVLCLPTQSHAGLIPFDTLEARWARAVAEMDVPGMSVAVVNADGVLYEHSFGYRNLDRTLFASVDTMYYIASSTKSFTAMAILQLVDSGDIDLDDPVTAYLPDLILAEAISDHPLTVRDLLTHGQGLTNEIPVSLHESYTGHTISDEFFYSRIAAYVGQSGSFRYGNLHYSLLGRVISSVTGMPWQEYIQAHILDPAGLTQSTPYASKAAQNSNTAEMIYRDGPGRWRRPDIKKIDSSMSPAGGMYASIHDLARWVQIHMNQGSIESTQLISPELARAARTPQVEVSKSFSGFKREHYGFG